MDLQPAGGALMIFSPNESLASWLLGSWHAGDAVCHSLCGIFLLFAWILSSYYHRVLNMESSECHDNNDGFNCLIAIIMPGVTDGFYWNAITMRPSAAYLLGTMHGSWAVLIWEVDHG